MRTRAAEERLRSVVRRFSGTKAAGLPLGELLPILYPDVEDFSGLRSHVRDLLGGKDRVSSLTELRRILGTFDRQWYPSPVRVRLPRSRVQWQDQDGLRFAFDPESGSITPLVLAGNYEPHITAVMRQVCRPGWNTIDIGANSGYHTVWLASLVGPRGSVLAVEANPDNCLLVEAAAEANGFDNVRILPVALGRDGDWGWFTEHVGSNGGLLTGSSPVRLLDLAAMVPLRRLDDVIDTDTVEFMKIDVEGAEAMVLDGSRGTLNKHRPTVISEFSCEMTRRVSQVEPAEYLNVFAALDYQLYVIDRETPGQLTHFDSPDNLLKWWPDELHIEDLLFLPKGKKLETRLTA